MAALIIIVAVCVSVEIYARLHGGFAEMLHLPPARDASTPASQQGYTLVDLVRPDDDDRFSRDIMLAPPSVDGVKHQVKISVADIFPYMITPVGAGIWIQTPQLTLPPGAPKDPADYIVSADNSKFNTLSGLHVTCKADGDKVFALPWDYFQNLPHPLLFVPIPAGYSDALKHIDVIVSDNRMRIAHWRIGRLPASKHILSGVQRTQDRFHSGPATITAEALRFQMPFPGTNTILVRLYPRLVRPAEQWDLVLNGMRMEWEPYGRPIKTTEMQLPLTSADADKILAEGISERNLIAETPFVDDDRYVQVSGKLRHFDERDETVTFHDVPVKKIPASDNAQGDDYGEEHYVMDLAHPLTQTTPSGICVRLPQQGFRKDSQANWYDSKSIAEISPENVASQPGSASVSLPVSPLQHKYGRSPSVSFRLITPSNVWTDENVVTADGFHQMKIFLTFMRNGTASQNPGWKEGASGKTLDVAITFHQRIDIGVTPFTFTLPVRDASHKEWKRKPWTIVQK